MKGGGNKSTRHSDGSLADGAVEGAGSPLDRAGRGALLGALACEPEIHRVRPDTAAEAGRGLVESRDLQGV